MNPRSLFYFKLSYGTFGHSSAYIYVIINLSVHFLMYAPFIISSIQKITFPKAYMLRSRLPVRLNLDC